MSAVIPETDSIKSAVLQINSIEGSRLSKLLSRILQRLHLKERSFTEEEEQKLGAALSLDTHTLRLLLEALSFILEQAVYHGVKPGALRILLEQIGIDSEKAEIFSQLWASAAPHTLQEIRHNIFTPSKLECMSWSMNLQMARSDQIRLKSPSAIINLRLTKEELSQTPQDVFLEFNHQELLELYNQMEKIQTQLDSLT